MLKCVLTCREYHVIKWFEGDHIQYFSCEAEMSLHNLLLLRKTYKHGIPHHNSLKMMRCEVTCNMSTCADLIKFTTSSPNSRYLGHPLCMRWQKVGVSQLRGGTQQGYRCRGTGAAWIAIDIDRWLPGIPWQRLLTCAGNGSVPHHNRKRINQLVACFIWPTVLNIFSLCQKENNQILTFWEAGTRICCLKKRPKTI